MKIATWNIERLDHKAHLEEIQAICHSLDADILVLTEADKQMVLNYPYCWETEFPASIELPGENGVVTYRPTERRIIIYSRYPLVKTHKTYDSKTALCVELKTPRGNLLVYGTIMGIFGIGGAQHKEAIEEQSADIRRFVAAGYQLCVCGDFNCSFAGKYAHTKFARETLLELFADADMELLTAGQELRIDHIAVSRAFLTEATPIVQEGELDKRLSDHIWVSVTI